MGPPDHNHSGVVYVCALLCNWPPSPLAGLLDTKEDCAFGRQIEWMINLPGPRGLAMISLIIIIVIIITSIVFVCVLRNLL